MKKLFFRLFSVFLLSVNPVYGSDLLQDALQFSDYSVDRRVGIEVEYGGLSLIDSLNIIKSMTGGEAHRKDKRVFTTLKSKGKDGLVFNEQILPEWIIETTDFGKLILKIDNNQKGDDDHLKDTDAVIELVTPPIYRKQVFKLQKILNALQKAGAKGTSFNLPVSIQINTEINQGDLSSLNWIEIVNLLRVYYHPENRVQVSKKLMVPEFRQEYLFDYSKGFITKIMNTNYSPTARQLYDDFIYRQSLEFLGYTNAWQMPIAEVKQELLKSENPIVPRVVKQNSLRISSLLMKAFPDDPMTQIYISSGWALPMPIVEWREFNNDFDVVTHYKESIGLMAMVEKYGFFRQSKIPKEKVGSFSVSQKLKCSLVLENFNFNFNFNFNY